jgi:uncharacterized membrane protein YdjX (TVP38/TMEM64 family)
LLRKLFPALAGLAVMAGMLYSLDLDWAALFRGDINAGTSALRSAAERQGPFKGLAMLLMIGLLPLVLVPVTLTLLAAALLLPPLEALGAMILGTLLNTVLAHSAGRLWGRTLLLGLGMDRLGPFKAVESGAREHGFSMALFSRCIPIPFSITGVASAVLGIRLGQMLLGTFLMLLPWELGYVFFTEALRRGDAKFMGPMLAFLALALFVPWFLRKRMRRPSPVPLSAQEPPLGPLLILYTLPGHDASDEAREELVRLRPLLKFEVQEHQIGRDDALGAQYQDLAPVLFMGEKRLFSFQVDENALRRQLGEARD